MLIQLVRTGQTEPAPIVACQATEVVVLSEDAPLDQVVEVAEPPWNQPETCNAEQGIQNLTVDLDPDLPSAVVVIAAGMAHRGSGVENDEEDHRAPGYHIEAVYCKYEAEGGQKESPEGLEADQGRLPPGMLRGKSVAVRVCACLVRANW